MVTLIRELIRRKFDFRYNSQNEWLSIKIADNWYDVWEAEVGYVTMGPELGGPIRLGRRANAALNSLIEKVCEFEDEERAKKDIS